MIEWATGNDGKDRERSDASAANTVGESMTVQSMADEADLNVIMRRFAATGTFPQTTRIPSYGDYTQITDFRSALEAIRDAEENFMGLEASVRARFQNDPQAFLEFCSNESNREEMAKLGLLNLPAPAVDRSPVHQDQAPNTAKQ